MYTFYGMHSMYTFNAYNVYIVLYAPGWEDSMKTKKKIQVPYCCLPCAKTIELCSPLILL